MAQSDTWFRKGYDPRRSPGGRVRTIEKIKRAKAKALEHAEEMIAELLKIAKDPKARPRDRVAAAKEVLDRGIGKPATVIAGDAELPGVSIGPDARLLEMFRRLASDDEDLSGFKQAVAGGDEKSPTCKN